MKKLESKKIDTQNHIQLSEKLQKVDHFLMRSAQIQPEELKFLVDQEGLTDVINLKTHFENSLNYNEKDVTKSLELNYIEIPTVTRNPKIEKIVHFLDITDELKKQNDKKALVHCKAGADRTGMYVLFYELKNKIKNFNEATEEMLQMGHHKKIYPDLIEKIAEIAKKLNLYR